MSVRSEPYYWVECDGVNEDATPCGRKSTEGGEISAWSDVDGAESDADCRDWDIVSTPGKHYCPFHIPKESEE